MNHTQDGTKSGTTFQTLVGALILALVAGGTSPWWWTKLFPEKPPTGIENGKSRQTPVNYMGALEGGTTRYGSDFANVGIQSNSAAECSDSCAADLNCKAMTFVKHDSANGGICWLKGAIPSPTADSRAVSAIKLYR